MNASTIAAAALLAALAAETAAAQPADGGGRSIKLVIGTDVGGSYDATGRLIARHLGKHLPGAPSIQPQNMPGAGGLIASNFLYNLAPRDGSVIGVIVPQVLVSQMFGDANARFDSEKFNWIGNPLGSAAISAVFHTSPVRTWREAKTASALMGATGAAGPDAFAVRLANATLGAQFRLITGYKGGSDMSLAMERGEIHGRGSQTWAGWKATNPAWVMDGRIIPLWQIALKSDRGLEQTPLLVDLVEGEQNKALVKVYSAISSLGRPFLAPPGVASADLARFREAFEKTMADPEFIADAAKVGIELGAISGEELQTMMIEFKALDATLRAKLKAILEG